MKKYLSVVIISVASLLIILSIWTCFSPNLRLRMVLTKMTGEADGAAWEFSENTFNHNISSSQIAEMYLRASQHVGSLTKSAKSYVYEDSSGYMGCITLIQHENSFEYVAVFGGNDSDTIMAGRKLGSFPPEVYKILGQENIGILPTGVIRPW